MRKWIFFLYSMIIDIRCRNWKETNYYASAVIKLCKFYIEFFSPSINFFFLILFNQFLFIPWTTVSDLKKLLTIFPIAVFDVARNLLQLSDWNEKKTVANEWNINLTKINHPNKFFREIRLKLKKNERKKFR
mgnify:CR=1 FL=1